MPQTRNPFSYQIEIGPRGELRLEVAGRLDAETAGRVWRELIERVEREAAPEVCVQADGLEYCDGAGIGLFLELRRRQQLRGGTLKAENIPEQLKPILELFRDFEPDRQEPPHPEEFFVEEVGAATHRLWRDLYDQLSFRGELIVNLIQAALNPKSVRWRDAALIAEKAGANALGIVALVGGLLGLILAFQSAAFMKLYGAEIYVANLVGISIIRELGPLMTAIILAGRTGSAFAAELGTMKVNEEIDALETMGLKPMRFLVVPRVLAAVFVMPFLTLFANFCGLAGGAFVMLTFGYPLVTYVSQVQFACELEDLLTGLFKSLVFGYIVALVGCMRGLQTKSGAGAVGDSATSAVVTSIVLIAIWDGIFSVLFFYMDI